MKRVKALVFKGLAQISCQNEVTHLGNAGYYKSGGTNAGYWDYSTQSDTAPTAELPSGTDMVNGSANYLSGGFVDTTYYTTEVGAYDAKPSDSAYGTFDQGGNVGEWNETDTYGDGWYRGWRGGPFNMGVDFLRASHRGDIDPGNAGTFTGFRVANIPEPSTAVLLIIGAVGFLVYSLRRKK